MTRSAIRVSNMTIGYDNVAVLKNISFDVAAGSVFVIMGPSGCGKSTLMRAMAGLLTPMRGSVQMDDSVDNIGVLFQGGALFTSMSVFENIALPLMRHTDYSAGRIAKIVSEKLALVGLPNVGDKYPAQLSGGMKKRVGLARALALNPSVLYLDEPSAGLDPIAAGQQDDLILKINRELGTTIVMVSHDLDSIFAVADDAIFLNPATHTIAAHGNPRQMLRRPPNREVLNFLTRGKK
ncbi:MAG: ATP-binding cassette domain-containing protein [Alphaproteobacteria bacterium]|nr:ATP-binding cassette domain-containing protein [Alphaproteobacteria bacterium]